MKKIFKDRLKQMKDKGGNLLNEGDTVFVCTGNIKDCEDGYFATVQYWGDINGWGLAEIPEMHWNVPSKRIKKIDKCL